jgi:hypothetical protein
MIRAATRQDLPSGARFVGAASRKPRFHMTGGMALKYSMVYT